MLKVPYVKQFNDFACFPATVTMVLKLNGIAADQRTIYRRAQRMAPYDKRKSPGVWDSALMLALKDRGVLMETWMQTKRNTNISKLYKKIFAQYQIQKKYVSKLGLMKQHGAASIRTIKKLIDEGFPVIADVHAQTWYGKKWRYYKELEREDSHIVLVTGYTKSRLAVSDPYRGKLKVTTKHFSKAWSSTPSVKNYMAIIRKV